MKHLDRITLISEVVNVQANVRHKNSFLYKIDRREIN